MYTQVSCYDKCPGVDRTLFYISLCRSAEASFKICLSYLPMWSSLVPRPHFLHPPEKWVWSTAYSILFKCAGMLTHYLTLDIIKDSTLRVNNLHCVPSLVPRPLPDFISHRIFLHGCEIKSGSDLGMRLLRANNVLAKWTMIREA